MIIDSTQYSGPCACGRTHNMVTKAAFIEPDALLRTDEYLTRYGLSGKRVTVYDENTYRATADRHPQADTEIILNPDHLHANEAGVAALFAHLPDDAELMLAIGSGTVHDLTRYCASQRGIPFVSCPTAASVDGFCSAVAAMTWDNCKKTMPAVAPVLVIADLSVIAAAPLSLALSGVGDMVGKYVSVADWRISHLVTSEHICEPIAKITEDASRDVMESAHLLASGDLAAFEKLVYGLLMSGLGIQLYGNSRPASGAEHHISHCIEMEPAALGLHNAALHGEKVGVGCALACGEYHRLAALPQPHFRDYEKFSRDDLLRVYGSIAAPGVLAENEVTSADRLRAEDLACKWPEVCTLIKSLPTRQQVESFLSGIGAKSTLADIGVSDTAEAALFTYSPAVRTRLTMMRLRRMIRD